MSLVKHLSRKIGVPEYFIKDLINQAPHSYKKFTIPKRNTNELRTVYQPSKIIKALQRIIINDLLGELKIHKNVFSYRKGVSIADNATQHKSSNYFLRIDFKNFFESITKENISNFLHSTRENIPYELSDAEFDLIAKLASFYDNKTKSYRLVIGSPMSPLISNAILINHDTAISNYCQEHEITYTRYADDLFLSAKDKNKLGPAYSEVERIISKINTPKLIINHKKTIHTSKKHKTQITGLVITSDNKTSIGRDKKREIKALLHKLSLTQLDNQNKLYLSGTLSYIYSVEPEFIDSLEKKYGTDLLRAASSYQE